MPAQLNSDAQWEPPAAAAATGTRRARWHPVADLPALARALLSEDLGGRDVVPRHVADRVTAEATEWAKHGFTEDTVRPWKDLPPAAAGHLAGHQVDPRVLDLPVAVVAGTAPVPLRLAISSGRLTAERAYQLLVLTGEHTPPGSTADQLTPPPPRPVTPVLFSHAADEQPRPAAPGNRPTKPEPPHR